MIQAVINRSSSGLIESFTLSGHADFDVHGKDIVCAGASAVVFGAVNAVHKLTGITPIVEQGGDGGYLSFQLPQDLEQEAAGKAQLLLEGMLVSLQSIELSYGHFIHIVINNNQQEVD
ncbi:ribosomal-processing cysteine protease Prp [Metabacillus indicus]|uniref:ribosomal-processing cysteine protease Prp n=1 Tax=Metabacillus indicus TaxID=246786 RepID=UPI002493B01D|nr:ribosomal-processing cysteine protease Prp [Metabacillus indicus]MDX8289989.1 ribosomal-processing cysteine protease Prp [Metabacillus indicus]